MLHPKAVIFKHFSSGPPSGNDNLSRDNHPKSDTMPGSDITLMLELLHVYLDVYPTVFNET